MILVLERRKGHSEYPFSSFSLLFLLAFDSINELVGVNEPHPRPYRFVTRSLCFAKAIARSATCKNSSMLMLLSEVGQPIYSSPAACTICIVCPWSATESVCEQASAMVANNERTS